MSKKFSAARKRAFLDYLAQTGNQTLSAERAKVSRSWVCLHRKTDPEFDAACREAIEVAKMMLRDDVQHLPPPPRGHSIDPGGSMEPLSPLRPAHAAHESPSPPGRGRGVGGSGPSDPKWRYHEGVELVVGGTNGRRTQVRRANVGSWTPKVEERFLAVLAGTSNVRLACREVGMSPPAAYNHRNKFPGFARAWDQAVEIGMSELESQVHENLNHFFDRDMPEPEVPMRDVSIADAIRVVRMYEKRALRRAEDERRGKR